MIIARIQVITPRSLAKIELYGCFRQATVESWLSCSNFHVLKIMEICWVKGGSPTGGALNAMWLSEEVVGVALEGVVVGVRGQISVLQ